MSSGSIDDVPRLSKYRFLLFPALIVAGLAGNYFKFPLFLNIDFLFGSIFALLALQFFGLGRGIAAAALITSYTYILWNHPYAIIIMTAEVATVGWLMGRRKTGIVLADILYWLVIGMPLVYLFYHFVMHVPDSSCFITITKQALNGIANALTARLIFTIYALRSRSSQMAYREIVYNMMASFVLYPALIMLVISGRKDFRETDQQIRYSLTQTSQRLDLYMENWVANRKASILNLAEIAASKSPQQMQLHLEQAKKSDVNFLRIGLLGKEATTTAYFPLIDELGQSNIGKNYADRPFIPHLKMTLKPILSEVVMGKIGSPKPIVLMLAPVVINGEYGGFVSGALGLEEIRKQLDSSLTENATFYTLLDRNGNIIITNRLDQKVMTPLLRGKGVLSHFDKNTSQWVPELPPSTPASERWKKSFYISQTDIGDLAEWKLILEQPVVPFQKKLYDSYTDKLTLLFLTLLVALALAELLSRKTVATIKQLRMLTQELPVKLVAGNCVISWPESGIEEASSLIDNFREMSDSLAEQFIKTRNINETLEQRVEERTEKLQMSELSLQKSEEKITQLLQTTDQGIYGIGLDGCCTFINKAGLNTLCYQLEDCIGKNMHDLAHHSHADGSPYPEEDCPIFRALLSGVGCRLDSEVHWRRDGTSFPVEYSSHPIFENGEIQGAVVTFTDITVRKLSAKELSDAKELAESANLAKSEFIANMSHEIRTPMNGVIGMANLLAMGDLSEEQRLYVDALKVSGNNLMSLINDILDLSKIEAGKILIESTEFSLRHCINDIILTQKYFIDEKGLFLNVDLAENIPHVVFGDQLRLRQILLNILGNAIKFTAQGCITISAQLLKQRDSSVFIELAVRDTGIGISPDALDKIFMPFVQEDGSTTRQFGGTGLGLTISRRLSELMEGRISVESTLGTGSCFKIVLPFTVIHKSEPVVETLQKVLGGWDGPSLRILFVDDKPVNMIFGTSLLRKLGHNFVTAANGSECLTALDQDTFDVVLMDIQMPVMNGDEALREIRRKEVETGLHQPVIALTAYSMSGEKDRFLEAGFDGYVSKPLVIEELVGELSRVMGLKIDITDCTAKENIS